MSRNLSQSLKPSQSIGLNNEDNDDFDPSKIKVFLDIAENDLIPKLIKYININGGVRKRIIKFYFYKNKH